MDANVGQDTTSVPPGTKIDAVLMASMTCPPPNAMIVFASTALAAAAIRLAS